MAGQKEVFVNLFFQMHSNFRAVSDKKAFQENSRSVTNPLQFLQSFAITVHEQFHFSAR